MKWLGLILFLCAAAQGCYERASARAEARRFFTDVSSALVECPYRDGRVLDAEVKGREAINKLLSGLEVVKTEHAFRHQVAWCIVTLVHNDGSETRLRVYEPDMVEVRAFGLVYIRGAFYKEICRVLTDKYGKGVDPIKDNKAR